MSALTDVLARIRADLARGHFTNEAAVTNGVVMPILHELGWPVFDTSLVAPQFAVENRRVDLALCQAPGAPVVFIEVKQPGRGDGADRQLFEYAFHIGVPMAVLTDGAEWHFYLPAEQGAYQERRVYKLDVREREVEESAFRFERYLACEAVREGAAIRHAREDYQNVRRERLAAEKLPEAWLTLMEENDLLVALLTDRVESLCGYRPDAAAVVHFLATGVVLRDAPDPRPRAPVRPRPPRQPDEAAPTEGAGPAAAPAPPPPPRSRPVRGPTSADEGGPVGFWLDGEFHPCRSAREVLVSVLRALARRDPAFLARFDALPRHGQRRRYVARDRARLYPNRPDLARDHAEELQPGWWAGTNVGTAQVEMILRLACETAGLRFGSDLRIHLTGPHGEGERRPGRPRVT